ncbi:hypothetical protein AAEO56_01090 [Flavobacterium sp. DGU11]|uniref:Uncharacterized protein n=1 Tax=Flavobacterium arundinis TaxID=3139143 RepID=A0ABU9HRR0_9FLAO
MHRIFIEFQLSRDCTEQDLSIILSLCEELLPPPKKAYITQTKKVKEIGINSFNDKEVFKAFSRNKYGIEYECGTIQHGVLINASTSGGVFKFLLEQGDEYKIAKEMALKLTNNVDLKKLEVAPVNFRSFDRKYAKEKRTTDFPGLYWLQYYDAEEFKKQGGKAIFDNPYIDAQLIKDGIFIEVGKSPYDFQTPEGETLMINANAAMPTPIK